MNRQLRWRLFGLLLALCAVVGLAIAWSASPLREWLQIDRLTAATRALGQAYGPVAAVAAFAGASMLAVPVGALMLVALVAFGPWAGLVCIFAGAVAGAALSYGLGRWLGHTVLLRMGGARVNAISQRLARRGVWAVVFVRVVPIAPFAVVNMVAGASHIRLRDMLLGTALGVAPSAVTMAFFIDPLMAALRDPGWPAVALGLAALLLIGLGGWVLRRWFRADGR